MDVYLPTLIILGFVVFFTCFYFSKLSRYRTIITQLENDKVSIAGRCIDKYIKNKKASEFEEKKARYLFKQVIVIPNKNCNPIIGTCLSYDNYNGKEQISIKDYVSDQIVYLNKAKFFIYHKNIVIALYKLTPEERFYMTGSVIDEKYKSSLPLLSKYEILEKVEKQYSSKVA